MARIARVVVPELPHHITQRGNFGQDTFFTDEDRTCYLSWLKAYAQRYGLRIWAWCLMTNHVHFVAVPEAKGSMAKTFNQTHMRHAQRINSRFKINGHLWQARFYSCVLDEPHLYRAVRYVENNPVRAGLVRQAQDYLWSSARAHVEGRQDRIVAIEEPLSGMIGDWHSYLQAGIAEDSDWVRELRNCTRSGLPVGSKDFVSGLERQLGRVLRSAGRGRPRKMKKRRAGRRTKLAPSA